MLYYLSRVARADLAMALDSRQSQGFALRAQF